MEVEQYDAVMKKLGALLGRRSLPPHPVKVFSSRRRRGVGFLRSAMKRRKEDIARTEKKRKEDINSSIVRTIREQNAKIKRSDVQAQKILKADRGKPLMDVDKKILIRSNGFKVDRGKPSMTAETRNSMSSLLRDKINRFKRRNLTVSSREDEEFDLDCTSKRGVTIESCKNCCVTLRGVCTSITLLNCKKVKIQCLKSSFHIKSGRMNVIYCQNVTLDVIHINIPIVTIENSKQICVRLGDLKKSKKRLYTSRCKDISVRVNEKWYSVPANQPTEQYFLITYMDSKGKMLSEMGMKYGLLVIPKSEYDAKISS